MIIRSALSRSRESTTVTIHYINVSCVSTRHPPNHQFKISSYSTTHFQTSSLLELTTYFFGWLFDIQHLVPLVRYYKPCVHPVCQKIKQHGNFAYGFWFEKDDGLTPTTSSSIYQKPLRVRHSFPMVSLLPSGPSFWALSSAERFEAAGDMTLGCTPSQDTTT